MSAPWRNFGESSTESPQGRALGEAGCRRFGPSGRLVDSMSSQLITRVVSKGILVAVLCAGPAAAEPFRAKIADKYPAKQKQGDLIVAVKAFVSNSDQESAFGKLRPYKYGVTPLLIVASNTGTNTYSLENLKVRLVIPGYEGIDPVSVEDLATINPSGHQPTRRGVPGIPGLGGKRVKKGPLNRPEIERNQLRAPIIAPKSTANGFMYYLTGNEQSLSGASAYITGIYDITNGRELFYFEIPLGKVR